MSELTTVDRYIIAARLKALLSKPQLAVDLLTECLVQYPGDIRLLRHRGHRRISTRDFPGAIEDFRLATTRLNTQEDGHEFYQNETETDVTHLILGRLDRVRVQLLPLSQAAGHPDLPLYMATLYSSIWYHLGVAEYLAGDLDASLGSFSKAEETSLHSGGLVASLDWQYMILRRLARDDDAQTVLGRFLDFPTDNDELEVGYVNRMRLYTGSLSAEDLQSQLVDNSIAMATQGYGLGNWYLCNGEVSRAREVFRSVIETGSRFAFGYLAAELDLARLDTTT